MQPSTLVAKNRALTVMPSLMVLLYGHLVDEVESEPAVCQTRLASNRRTLSMYWRELNFFEVLAYDI
jgi:hypothetical protein